MNNSNSGHNVTKSEIKRSLPIYQKYVSDSFLDQHNHPFEPHTFSPLNHNGRPLRKSLSDASNVISNIDNLKQMEKRDGMYRNKPTESEMTSSSSQPSRICVPNSEELSDAFRDLGLHSTATTITTKRTANGYPGQFKLQASGSPILISNIDNSNSLGSPSMVFHNPNSSFPTGESLNSQSRDQNLSEKGSSLFSSPDSQKFQAGKKHHLFTRMSTVRSRIRDKISMLKTLSPSSVSALGLSEEGAKANLGTNGEAGIGVTEFVLPSIHELSTYEGNTSPTYSSFNNATQNNTFLNDREMGQKHTGIDFNNASVLSTPMRLDRQYVSNAMQYSGSPLGSERNQYSEDPFHISYVANRGSATQNAPDLIRSSGETSHQLSFAELYEPVSACGMVFPSSNSGSSGGWTHSSNFNRSPTTRQNLFVGTPEKPGFGTEKDRQQNAFSTPNRLERNDNGSEYQRSLASIETLENVKTRQNADPEKGPSSTIKKRMGKTTNALRRLRSFSTFREDKDEASSDQQYGSDNDGKYDSQGDIDMNDADVSDNVVDWCVKMTPNSYYQQEGDGRDGAGGGKRSFIRRLSRSSKFKPGEEEQNQSFDLRRSRSKRLQKIYYRNDNDLVDEAKYSGTTEIYQDPQVEKKKNIGFISHKLSWISRAPSTNNDDWNGDNFESGYGEPNFSTSAEGYDNEDFSASTIGASGYTNSNGFEIPLAGTNNCQGPYSMAANYQRSSLSRHASNLTVRSFQSGRSMYSNTTASSKSSAGGHGTFAQRTVLRSKINTNGDEERERLGKQIEEEALKEQERAMRRRRRREEREKLKMEEEKESDNDNDNIENMGRKARDRESGKRVSSIGTNPRSKKRQKKNDSVKSRSQGTGMNGQIASKSKSKVQVKPRHKYRST